MICGFRREVAENCAPLGHYAANGGNFVPTFRDNLSVPSTVVKEDGNDRFSGNAYKRLPLFDT